jgi:hypothetical protein
MAHNRVIHYDSPEKSQSIIMRILGITQEVIRVRLGGSETRLKRSDRRPPQASNKSLQPTAGRRDNLLFSMQQLSILAELASASGG